MSAPIAAAPPHPLARRLAAAWDSPARRWLPTALGAAAALGFAPTYLWPLTLLALAVLVTGIASAKSPASAFWRGWGFGVGIFTIGNGWIATAFTFQSNMPAWLGMLAVPALAVYLAVWPGVAALVAKAVVGRRASAPSLPLVLAFAGAWIVGEWLRSWVFSGFAWNPLAAIAPAAAAPAALIGSYGQSGLIVLAAGALTLLATNRTAAMRTALALLAAWGVGAAWLALSPTLPPGPQVTVVQPLIAQGDKWDPRVRDDNMRRLLRQSARPASLPDATPRLLLWPEAGITDYIESGYPPLYYDIAPDWARRDATAALERNDWLLSGAPRLEVDRSGTRVIGARNAVFALSQGGRLHPLRYDKAHLVPYGEYLPMRSMLEPLGLARLTPGDFDFWPGAGPRTLDWPLTGGVGVAVCYEIIFSGRVVDRAHRPRWLFNPSNDAWFGPAGPPQHLAQARLRAIEEGLPVIRSTPTGVSAIIDASGRVLERIPLGEAGRIDGTVPGARAPSPFARVGNALPLLLALVLLAAAAIASRRPRR